MLVNIANDGPVTLELDSRKFEYLPITNQSNPAVFKALKAAANSDSKPKSPQREHIAHGKPGNPFSNKQGHGQQQQKKEQEQGQDAREEREKKDDVVSSVAEKLTETLTFEKDPEPENK